jgi:hypothetical protein
MFTWCDDLFAEQAMRKFNLKWKIEDVPFDRIDWEESQKNCARIGDPLTPEHVADLQTALRHGDVLPRVVLLNHGRKLVYAAGNHRGTSARNCGATSISAYVVSTTDEKVIQTLPSALNAPMRMQARDERIRLALIAIDRGLTVKEASSSFSISEAILSLEISAKQTREELQACGVNTSKVARTVINELGKIQNANVLAAAGRVVTLAKLTTDETIPFTREIRRQRTEAQQMAVVAAKEIALGIDGKTNEVKVKAILPKATKIRRLISSLEGYLTNVRTINQLGFTEKSEKTEFIDRWTRLATSVGKIIHRS